ncbi:hypothetical protein [uncultured Amaricoccus sp.]|uniref:hypothetical protein n=1 Tax=uncultured Amaricoccus sp. TaxID=339341 RepID=UPI002626DB1C|nr:hypothetical protein [uncultured Amaricoccus sp.]
MIGAGVSKAEAVDMLKQIGRGDLSKSLERTWGQAAQAAVRAAPREDGRDDRR